ncbi:MAG: response regulator [Anaerolineae bacterium]|nr:response regulator [Anaerolineae bacterium]
MRILYVEDNPANVFLVQRVARIGNHEIIHYTEGQPALDNFERDKPDLVLMDVQLPGAITGLDAVRSLRAKGYKTPIVAVTAYAMVGDREKCLDAGCDAYLSKPMPVPELIDLIKRYEPIGQKTAAEPATSKVETLPVAAAQPSAAATSPAVPAAAQSPAQPEIKPSVEPTPKPEASVVTVTVEVTEAPTEPSNPTAPLKTHMDENASQPVNGDSQKTVDAGQSVSPPVNS